MTLDRRVTIPQRVARIDRLGADVSKHLSMAAMKLRRAARKLDSSTQPNTESNPETTSLSGYEDG